MNKPIAILLLGIMSFALGMFPLNEIKPKDEKRNLHWKQVKLLELNNTVIPTGLSFSPDNKMLSLAFSKETVIWDTTNWQVLQRLPEGVGYPHEATFSPNGKWLAISNPHSKEFEITLYHTDTWKLIHALPVHQVTSRIQFSPDSKLLAFGVYVNATQCHVELCDVATGQEVRSLADYHFGLNDIQAEIYALAFSPDGKLLATGTRSRSLKLWDVKTGRLVRTFQGKELGKDMAHRGWVGYATFSPDGTLLASGDSRSESLVKIWDVRKNDEQHRELLSTDSIDKMQGLAFSPNGKLLAASSLMKVVIWDITTWKEIWFLVKDRGEGGFADVAFSPDGRLFAFINYAPGKKARIEIWQSSSKAGV